MTTFTTLIRITMASAIVALGAMPAAAQEYNCPLFFDGTYLAVGKDIDAVGNFGPIPLSFDRSVDFKSFISTLSAGYKFYENAGTQVSKT